MVKVRGWGTVGWGGFGGNSNKKVRDRQGQIETKTEIETEAGRAVETGREDST